MENKACPYSCVNGKVFLESLKGFVDCPNCRNIINVVKGEIDGENKYARLQIPDNYRDTVTTTLNTNMFLADGLLSRYSNQSVAEVRHFFEQLAENIFTGNVSRVSGYFFLSNYIDVNNIVYTLQKAALRNGLGVTPFISLNTLYAVRRTLDTDVSSLIQKHGSIKEILKNTKNLNQQVLAALDGYKFISDTQLLYSDFVNAELCFLDATAATTENGWVALADILSERAKKSLPTYVIGYWPTKTITYNKGIKYLISDNVTNRLDRLIPFEFQAKGRLENESVSKPITYDVVNNNALGGVSLESILD